MWQWERKYELGKVDGTNSSGMQMWEHGGQHQVRADHVEGNLQQKSSVGNKKMFT